MHTEITRHDGSTNWVILDTGIEICEQMYQSDAWKTPRRMVIVRQKIKDRPQAPDKQLGLFAEEEIIRTIATRPI